jgi:hypothetical protein
MEEAPLLQDLDALPYPSRISQRLAEGAVQIIFLRLELQGLLQYRGRRRQIAAVEKLAGLPQLFL